MLELDIENKYDNNVKFFIGFNLIFIFVLFFFGLVNVGKANNFLGFFELTVALGLSFSLLYYYQSKKIKFFLLFTTLALLLMSLVFHFNSDKTLYSSLYLLFFPLVAFLLNGLKIGKMLTLLYLCIILIDVYLGIGTYTDMDGFLHIAIALIVFSLISYLIECSRKDASIKMLDTIKHLENILNIDPLTLLYNRNYLNKYLSDEIMHHQSLLFCLTDIDNFKAYNDFYGHIKGDETLKEIATINKDVFSRSENGFVVRLGGEEFGGFIYDVSNPKDYVADFMKFLNEASLEHKNNFPYDTCTVSIGAVYCKNTFNHDFGEIYQAADEALYEAKSNGRNNVVWKEL